MTEETTGTFREISEMYETLKDITRQGKDAIVKKRKDGTFDVFELEKKKCKPRKGHKETE